MKKISMLAVLLLAVLFLAGCSKEKGQNQQSIRDIEQSQNQKGEGDKKEMQLEDYHSHNTEQQDVEGMKRLLSKLPLIRKEVFNENVLQYPD